MAMATIMPGFQEANGDLPVDPELGQTRLVAVFSSITEIMSAANIGVGRMQ